MVAYAFAGTIGLRSLDLWNFFPNSSVAVYYHFKITRLPLHSLECGGYFILILYFAFNWAIKSLH
jgi:hypothetical protein